MQCGDEASRFLRGEAARFEDFEDLSTARLVAGPLFEDDDELFTEDEPSLSAALQRKSAEWDATWLLWDGTSLSSKMVR